MKKLIAVEELAQLCTATAVFFRLPGHWGVGLFLLLFFSPDLFAVGFFLGNRAGTFMYNFSHHKMVAITAIAAGALLPSNNLLQIGLLFYAHSCFDRSIGYGLKYLGNPSHTHLGFIGKQKGRNDPDHL